MIITVIIPTYNEEKHIGECLSALVNGTRRPDQILVADGYSTDHTRKIAKSFPGVWVVRNPERTAAAGRNAALAVAVGDVIAFTDGDCIPADDWVEQIERAFSENEIDGMGGKVLNAPFENEYERDWGTLAWTLLMNCPDEPYVVEKQTLNDAFVTANCAYRKELLDRLGGFDLWFANNAEDVDLSWRALQAGARLMYIPDAVIYAHNVTSLQGIRKKSFRNGVSSSKLQKRYGGVINYDVNIYKMLLANLKAIGKGNPDTKLNLNELAWHLLGKYCGSIRHGVINI